jgi:ABC-type amino acid transport substrate-binding protein
MPYDAFISYCSEDKKVADAVCGTLEANKIRCWIAPRDVLPGRTWGSAIVDAIGDSAVMVVIFSQHSNGSPQVMREIERAVNKGVTIIPFRVEDVVPSKDLEYFISSCHWLDAMNPPLEQHIGELADAILALQRRGAALPGREALEKKPRRRSAALWIGLALAAIVVLAAGTWFFRPKTGGPTVELERPAPDSSLVGPLLLSWTTKDLAPENLSFEVSITPAGKPPILQRTARNSIVPQGIEGKVRWKVRPVWQSPGQLERFGQWNKEQTFTYYPSALNRIIATHSIHVGTAEPDGFFVRQDGAGAELTGYEIDLLRDLGTRILATRGISAKPTITYTRRIWGEDFFRLLERDGAVDLIASAISITPEREKTYALLFTQPTLHYPQTVIAKPGIKAFVDGKLVLTRVGAAEKTTNETLARKLLGDTVSERFVPYGGSGAYDRMLADLVAERIEGALIDKPYALQKVAELKQSIGAELALTDITAEIIPGIELEKMGFAVRKSDRALLQELDAQLTATAATRDGVLSKSIPGWSK